jgi:hypothetical protein
MTRRLARAAPAGLVVSLAIAGAEAQPACAQDMSALSGMQFFVTPYLWLSGINTSIKTPLARAPEVNSDVSAIDLLSHLNGVPFMGAFEVRQGPLGFLGACPRPGGTTSAPAMYFSGGHANPDDNIGTGLVLLAPRSADVRRFRPQVRACGLLDRSAHEPRFRARTPKPLPIAGWGRSSAGRTIPLRLRFHGDGPAAMSAGLASARIAVGVIGTANTPTRG